MGKWLKDNPAVVRSAITAVIGLLVALGVIGADLSDKITNAIFALLALFPIGAGIAIRQAVTPVTKATEVAVTAATEAATKAVEAVTTTAGGAVSDVTETGEAIVESVTRDVVRDSVVPVLKAPVDLVGKLPIFRR